MKAFLPLIIAISLVTGVLLGRHLHINATKPIEVRFCSGKMDQVLDYIKNDYVDTVNMATLEEAAIAAIIDSLDPHSVYIPASDLKAVTEPLEGKFSGIGVQFQMQNDTVVVIRTIPNGPSEKLGILPGDRIVKIEDTVVCGKNLPTDYIVKRLKGKKGTNVRVSIHRLSASALIDFTITRDDIPLYSVDVSYMIDPKTGYIKINSFSKTTADEFRQHSKKLLKQGMSQLILDLRGNGGGYLTAAIEIADEFLPAGKLIVYTQGKSVARNDVYATSNGKLEALPVIVLIDEWSASASEIVSGALQDNDRGIIVGRRSFGKGLVQQQITLNDGSALRLTVARYYTPTGRSIQKPYNKGSEDYELEMVNRINHGELYTQDSILFADSLKFTTPGGKTVYGGGGIMPDVFVSYDTTQYSDYYQKILSKGILFRFAFEYSDAHRTELTPLKTPEAIVSFLKKTNTMTRFLDECAKNGIAFDKQGYAVSGKYIENLLYAHIARNLIDNEGFYPIYNREDTTLKKSLELF